ncbi:MAG: hypothetical protein SGBAC_012608 [Bacillariaceae sp.]
MVSESRTLTRYTENQETAYKGSLGQAFDAVALVCIAVLREQAWEHYMLPFVPENTAWNTATVNLCRIVGLEALKSARIKLTNARTEMYKEKRTTNMVWVLICLICTREGVQAPVGMEHPVVVPLRWKSMLPRKQYMEWLKLTCWCLVILTIRRCLRLV